MDSSKSFSDMWGLWNICLPWTFLWEVIRECASTNREVHQDRERLGSRNQTTTDHQAGLETVSDSKGTTGVGGLWGKSPWGQNGTDKVIVTVFKCLKITGNFLNDF